MKRVMNYPYSLLLQQQILKYNVEVTVSKEGGDLSAWAPE